MSDDLISRETAIDAIDEQIKQCDKSLSSFDISMKDAYAVKVERASLVAFREILEYLPPAEPKRGKWIDGIIPNDSGGLPVIVCDQCNTFFPLQFGDGHNFCPNCGADMREKGENHESD